MKKLCVAVIAVLLCAMPRAQTPPDAFSPQMIKAFADYLFADGFFDEAESEYKRYLFSVPQPDVSAIMPLAALYNARSDKDGIVWLRKSFYGALTPPMQEKLTLIHGRIVFSERSADEFVSLYSAVRPELPRFSLDAQQLLALSDALLSQNIQTAAAISQAAARTQALFGPVSAECGAYKPKNAKGAVLLSGLVPGLGKWYGGTFSGFATDFIAVSACAAATIYTGIQSDWHDWRPYLFGAIGAALYVIDLYGSYKNVLRYNAAAYRRICEATDSLYEMLD